MGLDSIWDAEGEYLTKKSKGFKASSTGCDCCSVKLTTEEEVRKEAIDSLHYILRATDFFKWNIQDLLKDARKEVKLRSSSQD